MDYNTIMDLAADLGYELSVSGAETFRVEDSMARVIGSYGIPAEVFSIPNYLIVSILTETGKPLTRMRRIGDHGNNLDAVEKLNALLHEYGEFIIGRMGIPYRKRGVSVIAIAMDAPQNTIAALSGKIGGLVGVSVKTAYSGVISKE